MGHEPAPPLVSVIIPACNAGRTIATALASVFGQTYRDFEVIIIDDGSTDDTAASVAAYGAAVVYHYRSNGGPAQARNDGIRLARGRLIAFLDADDIWFPRKLERQVAYFGQFPSCGLVHAGAIVSDTPAATLLETPDVVAPDGPFVAPSNHYAALLQKTLEIHTVTTMVRRDVLDEVGLFDERKNPGDDERDLWLRIAAKSPIGRIPLPLAIRRPGGLTSRYPQDRPSSPRDTIANAVNRRHANLVQDTTYRRARSAITRAIHRIDAACSRARGRPLRVLFEAASPMSLAVFEPVFERLRTDARLEFWFTTCDASWNAAAIFGRIGVADHIVPTEKARWMKVDGYINTDFWNMTWLPRHTRRAHFFHGVAGKYGLDAPVRIAPVVDTFDRLLFPNRDRLRRYAEAGLVDAESPRAALIGYPKVDCLVDGSLDRRQIAGALGLDDGRPIVLYAPTWSPHSSLNRMGKEVVDALSRLDVNVIVKLHDRSYDAAARASGGIDWRQELDRFCRDRHVHLAEEADASPYLFIADALVTDHSSVGFEYMLVDRPLVVIDCPDLVEAARINPQKVSLLQGGADVVRQASDVAAAVHRGLRNPRRLSERRRAIADELFYRPGGATERAARCIYDLLECPVPADVLLANRYPERQTASMGLRTAGGAPL